MKISLNWLKKYVTIPETVSDDELIRLIGARLVEVEGVIDETHKYDNIYIVRVESCEKIPETHLTLCMIDAGQAAPVQVVCGAPNVRAGMLAVWIAPGATVPASVHEDAPFVIGKRKMKGYESNGMLAGADELDFGDDHSGIVEIEPDTANPGDLLSDVFELKDQILEIENKSLTHRPDTFGLIGFAREVAGILGQEFNEPDLADEASLIDIKSKTHSELKVDIEDSNICQRYTAVVLQKHGEPHKQYLTWTDTILSKSGMKPVDWIVDATNYLMLLTGQPLHAFDYDKFIAAGQTLVPEISIRLAHKGEQLTLLDDKTVELNENDIVICSGKTPVALAGAMGGKSTEIDDNTKNIILESATFSLYNLRKTQMAHGIFTEAITRFTKGQSPYQTMLVAAACSEMLSTGYRASAVAEQYPNPLQPIVVKITTNEINQLLGTSYGDELIVRTLANVGFKISNSKGTLEIIAPAWRTDIHIKEDITEEVGRLLGYDNITPTLPLHASASQSSIWSFKNKIRTILSKYGANEVLTYSFISGRLLDKAGQDEDNSYKIVNSISPELQFVRQSIVPSLLEKSYMNQKLPVETFAIFEMNKVYRKDLGFNDEKVPTELTSLGFVIAERKGTGTAYYKAKKYVDKLLEECGIEAEYIELSDVRAEAKPFEKKRSAAIYVDGEYVGIVGEFKNSVRHEFKLAPYLAGFELIDLETLMKHIKPHKFVNRSSTKSEDLTITTSGTYEEVLQEVRQKYPDARISPLSIYQAPGQKSRNITVRIEQ